VVSLSTPPDGSSPPVVQENGARPARSAVPSPGPTVFQEDGAPVRGAEVRGPRYAGPRYAVRRALSAPWWLC
jgi:hypothetical protein